jgi:3',5'-cyclic AMP phosphodiesterase CpdA
MGEAAEGYREKEMTARAKPLHASRAMPRNSWRNGLAFVALIACGGPLEHVRTDPRWLDPYTGRASAPLAVHTEGDPVRVAVYGDVRGERERHREVVRAIRAAHPDLVVFTGDALACLPIAHMPDFGLATYLLPLWPQYVRGYPWVSAFSIVPFPALVHEALLRPFAPPRDRDGFNAFLEDTAPLRLDDRTPFVFVPGNHDVYHRADRREVARLFVSNESRDPKDEDDLFFSMEIAGHRLHVLDTGDDLLGDPDPFAEGSRQVRWLDESLADAEKRGLRTIVATHMPPYSSNAEDAPSPTLRARFEEVFARRRVDLLLGGHAHAYERIERPGRAGRAITHIVTGGGGAPFHHEGTRDPGSKAFVAATTHFVLLELAPGEIRGRMVKVNGSGAEDAFVVPEN